MAQILICDDDLTFQLAAKQTLAKMAGHTTQWAKNTEEARVLLKKQRFDLLMLDIEMRTPDEGLEFLPWLRENQGSMPILMCSGRTDFEAVRQALRDGAWDYVRKDCEPEHLCHTVTQLLTRAGERDQASLAQEELKRGTRHDQILGESAAARQLREKLERFKRSDAPVLIIGETGTGKELTARSLRPQRNDGSLAPFVSVDSATIAESMAESILFGHEKGAFTGADRARPGLFEQASGGVIFFDELSNMPLTIQQKLLRILQEKEVTRLGSDKPIKLEFRVVCATNQDLEVLVRQGKFQADLLQRLNVLPIRIAPLRERMEDVDALARSFLGRGSRTSDWRFSDEAAEALRLYNWPGNIRELQNVVEYCATMSDGPVLEIGDLPERIRAHQPSGSAAGNGPGASLYENILKYEESLLREAVAQPFKSMSELAVRLGMDRSHLYTKLKQHGIKAAI